jgi:SAM-dependent methyltransferase
VRTSERATADGTDVGLRASHSTAGAQQSAMRQIVARHTRDMDTVRVLEAGCGSAPSPVGLDGRAWYVGLDISERQLARNTWAHEKILGDVQSFDLPRDRFDVVACWDVLEHLPAPERAMDNLMRATRPGGLIVIKVPNPSSLKGVITRFTPYPVHVWVYRHIFGYPDAGSDDLGPFPTHLRPVLAPPRLREFARERGLEVELLGTYEAEIQAATRGRFRVTGRRWQAICILVTALSGGRVDASATEVIAVFAKSSGAAP